MRSEHRKHDRLLITRFAMDDAYASERDEARVLVESCPDCAALAADIRQIADAVGHIPVPVRQRDFTIAADKAAELRGSRLARWMRGFATPRWGTLRPVAGVALSIGLVMAVVGTALPATQPVAAPEGGALTLSTTAAPEVAEQATTAPEPNVNPPALPAPGAGDVNAEASGGSFAEEFAAASEDPTTATVNRAYASPQPDAAGDDGDGERLAVAESPDTTRDLLVWAGLLIAVLSVGLLVLASIARRYFADPLLR